MSRFLFCATLCAVLVSSLSFVEAGRGARGPSQAKAKSKSKAKAASKAKSPVSVKLRGRGTAKGSALAKLTSHLEKAVSGFNKKHGTHLRAELLVTQAGEASKRLPELYGGFFSHEGRRRDTVYLTGDTRVLLQRNEVKTVLDLARQSSKSLKDWGLKRAVISSIHEGLYKYGLGLALEVKAISMKERDALLAQSVDSVGLHKRVVDTVGELKVKTVEDLLGQSDEALLSLPEMGVGRLLKLDERLAGIGLIRQVNKDAERAR